MIEKNRQFVIFGNFEKITFENVSLLNNVKNKYNLLFVAQEEIPQFQISNQQPSANFIPPIIRPAFLSADNKTRIFFGTRRIHIEENNNDSLSYDTFMHKSKEIIFEIIKTFGLQVDRIALNGTVINQNADYQKRIFDTYFKKSDVCCNDMYDWAFRVNNRSNNILKFPVNQIISAQLRKELRNNEEITSLYLTYDFNTLPNQHIENDNEILDFIEHGVSFRGKVLLDG